MQKRFHLISWLSFFFVISLLITNGKAQASKINFAVTPNLPQSQINQNNSYFDLKLDPNATENATVSLRNDTNEKVVVSVVPARATTNHAGVVQYSSTSNSDLKEKLDSSYQTDITKVISVPKQVTIPEKSQIEVPVKIKMPDKEFDGVIAGGLTFKQINVKEKEASGQANIINRYAYTVGVTLRNSTKEVAPQLNLGNIEATQLNYRNAIIANLHNKSAMYINNVAIDGFITQKNKTKKLYTVQYLVNKSSDGKQIAPNSIYGLPFYLEGAKFKPGYYSLDLTVKSKGHRWHFKKDFTIVSTKANKYNKTDVDVMHINWWLVFVVIIVLGILLWLFIILRRRKKRKEENKYE